ncbi:MAG: TAXI family TRAP transporter solute-binding subunit [Thermodesulfovibrio sp.]|nr:TAXI family TRAP transporter solute-binding subunit [Thermodesulfovibrio sp.]MCX7724125.1 TAXI family TRAP transporter solute-binding subunit [Thermodesulfovibrio sp.]MDW7971799.1 TAXI family TRAP transporter solute-binding subunit [Thermodesulfovibrio sp.]
MKRSVFIFLTSFLCFLISLGFLTNAEATKKFHVKWGATSVRSGLYANTVAMAKVVNKAYPGEIEVTVVETGGFLENLSRLQRKAIHIGPADAAAGYANYMGIIDYQGKPNPNLRTLWGGYITPIHIVVAEKTGIKDVRQLSGVDFAMNPGTTSGRVIELFFKALNITPNYKMMGIGASVDAMKSGVVKGWYKAGFKDSAILDLEANMDIRILPVPKQLVDQFNKVYPGQGLMMEIPAGLFKSVKTSQPSLAYVVTDFVDKDVPEDVVFKIVKAVYENRKEIVGALATLKEGNFEDMFGMAVKYINVPLHPGAVKFYRDVLKLKIPDKLIPPEMKKR